MSTPVDQDNVLAWREADAVLDRLLDVEDGERDALLARLDLSAATRACAERLLAAHRRQGALDVASASDAAAAVGGLRGCVMGRWRLGAEIGRGGMSVVYRAQSLDTPERLAALKLLTWGARAGLGLAQFRQEQAILARLRHPHIATLFDSGVAQDGTPWLAMALVDGLPIDQWSARHARSAREIVSRYLDVCDAVAHAHRNLIIHRDIKPSNVMVDEDGHVRLLDFGIARLADQHEGDTVTQWRVLTPDYAAPEQFEGATPSTAMDVYGLGALLFRLICGGPPPADVADRREPLALIAHDPAHTGWVAQARGDLSAIVLKALRHDPAQRYESVVAFADDLRRWLDGLPVHARLPTLRYRLSRYVRRHRAGVIAAATALLALVGGLAIALWQARLASLAATDARAQARQAELAQQQAERQLQRAEALRDFLTKVFVAADPRSPATLVTTVAALLDSGVTMARTLPGLEASTRADLLTTLGGIYYSRQDVARARAALDEAIAYARADGKASTQELARALIARGLVPGADVSGSLDEEYFVEASALLLAHAPQSLLRVDLVRDWAWAKVVNNRVAEAVAMIEPLVLGTWNGPAPRPDQRQRLLDRLASGYAKIGRLADAERSYDTLFGELRARGESTTRQFAVALINSVDVDRRIAAFDIADAKVREALAIYDGLGAEPSQYRASAHLVRALVLQMQGRYDQARAAYDAGNGEWARLQGQPLEDYAYTHLSRGRLAASMMHDAQTLDELERFLQLARKHGKSIARDRAEIGALQAQAHCALGRFDVGDAALDTAQQVLRDAGAFEAAPVRRAIRYAQLRCVAARCDWSAAAQHERELGMLDAQLARGEAEEFARHALLRAATLRQLGRESDARQLLIEADRRFDAAGLMQHPLRARVVASTTP